MMKRVEAVEIPLDSLAEEREGMELLRKAGYLPFLLERKHEEKILLSAALSSLRGRGVRSVYRFVGTPSWSYIPYPEDVWDAMGLLGKTACYAHQNAYYVEVAYSGYYVKAGENNVLPPFHTRPDGFAAVGGAEYSVFSRRAVEGAANHIESHAERYGLPSFGFTILFDEYLMAPSFEPKKPTKNHFPILYNRRYMVFPSNVYVDCSNVTLEPYKPVLEDDLKYLLGPEVTEILLQYGKVVAIPDADDVFNEPLCLEDDADLLACVRALRGHGLTVYKLISSSRGRAYAEVYAERGEAWHDDYKCALIPHEGIHRQVDRTPITVTPKGLKYAIEKRLIQEFDIIDPYTRGLAGL